MHRRPRCCPPADPGDHTSQGTRPIVDGESALRYPRERLLRKAFCRDKVMSAGRKTKRSSEGDGVDELHVWLPTKPKDRLVDLLVQRA